MKHNKLIAVSLILTIGVFLAAGCIGGGKKGKPNQTATENQTQKTEEKVTEENDTGEVKENETGGTEEDKIATADSIVFSFNATGPDYTGPYHAHYKARGLGTDETEMWIKIRVEGEIESEVKFILSEKKDKGWMKKKDDDKWHRTLSFDYYWDKFSQMLSNYTSYLSGWETGTYNYEDDGGNKHHFYGIQVNPSLDPDLFDRPDNVAKIS